MNWQATWYFGNLYMEIEPRADHQKFADDNGCEIEDLPTLMIHRNRWKECVNTCRARSIR